MERLIIKLFVLCFTEQIFVILCRSMRVCMCVSFNKVLHLHNDKSWLSNKNQDFIWCRNWRFFPDHFREVLSKLKWLKENKHGNLYIIAAMVDYGWGRYLAIIYKTFSAFPGTYTWRIWPLFQGLFSLPKESTWLNWSVWDPSFLCSFSKFPAKRIWRL